MLLYDLNGLLTSRGTFSLTCNQLRVHHIYLLSSFNACYIMKRIRRREKDTCKASAMSVADLGVEKGRGAL